MALTGNVRLLVVLAGCLLAGFVVLHRDDEPRAQQLPAVSIAPDTVQIQHRVVTVAPAPAPVAAVVKAAQKPRRVTRTDTPHRPFLARAGQLVLGDGRYRPQPFPQPRPR